MKDYIEITREMIEGCLDDELEMMFEEEKFKPSAAEHFKKIGTYEELFENYLFNNHIKVIDGKYYELDEEDFAAMSLAPDGRPLPGDKFEATTFGDR